VMKCSAVLDDQVAKKVIVPVSEASEWAAPLVVVRKVKTGKIRIYLVKEAEDILYMLLRD
jgi:hypothetical protein